MPRRVSNSRSDTVSVSFSFTESKPEHIGKSKLAFDWLAEVLRLVELRLWWSQQAWVDRPEDSSFVHLLFLQNMNTT